MADRRTGAGGRLSGVLERTTPLDSPQASESTELESPTQTDGMGEDEPVAAGRGRGRGTSAQASGRAASEKAKKKVRGRTIYLPDDLFERILVQAHRRDKTISDYVAAILERQVPDHRVSRGVDAGSEAGAV